jgi:PqqD family protein of HPr-rel-A system
VSQLRNGTEPKRASRNLEFYGDQFVFDSVSGNFHRLSEAAGFILKSLCGGAGRDELVQAVVDRYGVDPAKAQRDVEIFLSELSSLDLVEPPR